jgi:hypothetical protein
VLQLNRSSMNAYVAYGVCSRIFAMLFLGPDLGNSVSGLNCHYLMKLYMFISYTWDQI